jgi:hypothetical protein
MQRHDGDKQSPIGHCVKKSAARPALGRFLLAYTPCHQNALGDSVILQKMGGCPSHDVTVDSSREDAGFNLRVHLVGEVV